MSSNVVVDSPREIEPPSPLASLYCTTTVEALELPFHAALRMEPVIRTRRFHSAAHSGLETSHGSR